VVGAHALATGGSHDVHVALVILVPLLSTASQELLLLLLLDLGGLVLHLTGTGQRAVHLTTSQAQHQVEGRLLLNIVVATRQPNKVSTKLSPQAHG
jgi:hypothetical protein